MDLQTLRAQVRDLVSETTGNLPDSTLNDLVERCTQRAEQDFVDDYGATPRQMLATHSDTITIDGITLPSDFLRARTVRIGTSTLRYISLEHMPLESENQDATVYLSYYQQVPKLVNDTDTNWLLDVSSRLYVYGTALEYTFWNLESAQDRATYQAEYTAAMNRTARAHSPRPSGGWQRAKGEQRGYYSIAGQQMIFGVQF